MLKKWLLLVAASILMIGNAFAGVDVNKGEQAALDGIKGLGPTKSKAIIEERKKNGDFKDWADFEKRVKGIGEKSAAKLSEAGLTVNGTARAAKTEAKAEAKAETKVETKVDTKADAKAAAASAPATEKKKK
ncbi:MAG: helix-hairpin-helix domain-containing protein [Burkholderiaceae bacterium]|nr:helix-hairpin-helix domain-containing protein [Burkholderiaceae bacterium]